MIEVHPDVRNISGGPKQQWLRMHRDEVLDYYHKYGPDACMQRFNMRQYTLTNFLVAKPINYKSFTDVDKALLKSEQAMESYRELRHRLNDVEAQLEEMAPMVQIGYGFLSAVAKVMPAIELKKFSSKEDSLSLADIGKKSAERGQKPVVYVMESNE